MTSLFDNHRCKLLVLDIDFTRLTSNDLRTFFTPYGPIEWIEIFPNYSYAVIYFVSYLIVDRLVGDRTCVINENHLRLRRFRLDQINWNIDCHTLLVKFNTTIGKLTKSTLFHSFEKYRSYIINIHVYANNQALIFFSDYNCLDQLLLLPINSFQINQQSLVLERMFRRIGFPRKQTPSIPTRDVVISQLLNRIECLSNELREKSGHSREETQRLEAELFIVKNENALLKSHQNIEQHRTALGDISNRVSKRSLSNSSNQVRKYR